MYMRQELAKIHYSFIHWLSHFSRKLATYENHVWFNYFEPRWSDQCRS